MPGPWSQTLLVRSLDAGDSGWLGRWLEGLEAQQREEAAAAAAGSRDGSSDGGEAGGGGAYKWQQLLEGQRQP